MTKVYDFDVTVTSRHNELNDNLKESTVEDILRLSRFHNHIIDGAVTIDKQNSSFRAEISLRVPGHTLIASHEDYSLSKALDTAIERTKNQLMKIKSKVVDHRAAPPQSEVEVTASEDSEGAEL